MDTMNTTVMSTTVDEIEQLVEVRLTAKACQIIAYVFNYNGFRPFKPLTLVELWFCVWVTCNKARHSEPDELVSLIEQGYFVIPGEVKRIHNTLRYLHNLYEENH